MAQSPAASHAPGISKSPTGIEGFDDLTFGGLPTGRPSLICGSAGCGKTLFASTFLIHGAREYGEPGAAALDGAGRVLYANGTLTRLLGLPLDRLQGNPLRDFLDAESAARIEKLLGQQGGTRHSAELSLSGEDGRDLRFIASLAALRIGTISGHALTFTDVTERVRLEAAEQSERASRAVIASANEAVLVCDRSGIITHANAAAGHLSDRPLVGRAFADAVPLAFQGATGVMQSDDVVAVAISGSAVQGFEVRTPQAPTPKDYLLSAAPLQVANDQISGCVVTMVDLTQRKAAEKQQLLLMAELDHRVKNTLALVLSISSRTASNEESVQGFHKAFTGRIQALAATHNLLADRSWSDPMLRDVFVSELAPYVDVTSPRLALDALDLAVAPRAAIALGLVVHELATNAVKYGALSREGGSVSVRSRGRAGDDGALVVEWRETGGPEVHEPSRKGFGRTVISRSLQYSPQGGAELDFAPTGLVCTISIPSEDLR
jgi:PAS domain S-box-containing protein